MRRRVLFAVLAPLFVLILLGAAGRALSAPSTNVVVSSPCGESAFDTALATVQASGGGTITFNCTLSDSFISLSSPKTISRNVTLDGDSQITLSGGGFTLLFMVDPAGVLSLKNITLSDALNTSGSDGGAIQNFGALIVSNSVFSNNQTPDNASGGAIYTTGLLTITNSLFEDNQAGNGGALEVRWGNAKADISRTIFRNNQAINTDSSGWGGAMLIYDGGAVNLHGGEIFSNSARFGGGIFNHLGAISSTLSVDGGALIHANIATTNVITVGLGGGIYNAGWLTITAATLADNIANKGGGLFNNSGTFTFIDSTVSGNRADGAAASSESGAGISSQGGNGTLKGVTLSGNIGYNQGSAIRASGGTWHISNTTISNNVIVCPICSGAGVIYAGSGSAISLTAVTLAGNPFGQGAAVQVSFGSVSFLDTILDNTGDLGNLGNCASTGGTLVSLGHNFSNDNDPDCNLSLPSDISSSGQQLMPLANYGGLTLTRMPLPGSLLISHGQCLPAVPTDQRGVARPQGTGCDIGAVEFGWLLDLPLVWR